MKKYLIGALTALVMLLSVVGLAACGEHVHEAGSSWESDETGHWHACAGCEEHLDFAAHTAGDVQTDGSEDWTLCTVCGYEMSRTAHTHDYGTLVEEKAATCTQEGTKGHYTCSGCKKHFDEEYKEIEDLVIPMLAHKYGTLVAEKSATCTENGTKAHYTCSGCKKNFDESYQEITDLVIPMLAHDYGTLVAEKSATCTEDGTKAHYTCSACKKSFDEEYKEITDLVIPAGHKYGTLVKEKAATCTQNGTKAHHTCSECKKNFDESYQEIADLTLTATGHTYKETWTWTKANGVWGAELTLTCSKGCGEENATLKETASVEPGESGSYTATVTLGGKERSNNYTPTPAKVIVLAGQSNMVGHSYSKYLTEEEQTTYNNASFENVKIYLSVNPYGTANTTNDFVPVTGGMGREPDDKTLSAFGPEYGLAAYLSETYPGETFYIIKDATGGTTLYDRWYSPSSAEYLGKTAGNEAGDLYTHLIKHVEDGMQLLLPTMDAQIVSFMWMQGESDANATAHPGDYLTLWRNFVTDLEAEWAEYLPDVGMSIIQGGITKRWTYYGDVNFAKQLYAQEHSNAYYLDVANADWATVHLNIPASGTPDYAHLDAAAMLRFGEEMGKLFTQALKEMKTAPVYTLYTVPLDGKGTASEPYLLKSTDDFLLFSRLYSNGMLPEDVCVKLTAPVSIAAAVSESYAKAPFVGVGNGTHQFAGTFDGGGNTVTFHVSKEGEYAGLFHTNKGTIKNLTAEGTVAGGAQNVGGIVGYNYGTIEGCTNKVVLSVYSTIVATNLFHYGGIAGYSNGGTIRGCTNLAAISLTNVHTVGGIVGRAEGDVLIENCTNGAQSTDSGAVAVSYEVGGIAGRLDTAGENGGSIKDCTNYAPVTGSGKRIGGIAGTVVSGHTLTGCKNYGAVTSTQVSEKTDQGCVGGIAGVVYAVAVSDCHNYADVKNENSRYTGGILGWTNSSGVNVTDCTNSGAITGTDYTGGILGWTDSDDVIITSCTNSGAVTGTRLVGGIVGDLGQSSKDRANRVIEGCANSGTVKGTEERIGGIAGMSFGGVVRNCTNTGDVYLNSEMVDTAKIVSATSPYTGYLVGFNTSAAKCYVEGGYWLKDKFVAESTETGGNA